MFDYIKHNKYREINSSIPGTTVQIRLQWQAEESNMEPESLSLEEDGKNSKNKKRIAYRARKTHKLRECQTRRTRRYNEQQLRAKSGNCRMQIQIHNTVRIRGSIIQWNRCPMDAAQMPRVAYSLSTLFVACHVWLQCSILHLTQESLLTCWLSLFV